MAMRILVVALALGCAQSVVVRSKSPPVDIPQQNFMAQGRMEVNATAAASANATASAVPALQSADVYDADFPVDMASKTPQELRYQAQANYAKAIAALKKEAAEAEAARKEMEAQLRELQAAEAAAANAKAEAERAAQQAAGLRGQMSKEQAEAAASAEGKIDAMKKKHAELCAQIKQLEAEQIAASSA